MNRAEVAPGPARRYDSTLVTASLRAKRSPRSIVAIALVAVVALVVSGCDSGSAWIARVDKKPIDAPHFWDGVALFSGTEEATFPVGDAAEYALFLVRTHLLEQMNEENGTPVPPAAVAEVRDRMASQLPPDLPEWLVDQVVRGQANWEALVAHYGADVDNEAAIEEFYEENRTLLASEVCLEIIPGTSERELAEAGQRISEGADFAEVARAVAADQGEKAQGENEDGDVGCIDPQTIAQWFADPAEVTTVLDATSDSVLGPMPVAGGLFMLLRVRSVEIPTLDEVRPVIEQQIGVPGQEEATEALTDAMMESDIELNPRLGDWVPGVGYRPPAGAEQPTDAEDLPPELLQMLG